MNNVGSWFDLIELLFKEHGYMKISRLVAVQKCRAIVPLSLPLQISATHIVVWYENLAGSSLCWLSMLFMFPLSLIAYILLVESVDLRTVVKSYRPFLNKNSFSTTLPSCVPYGPILGLKLPSLVPVKFIPAIRRTAMLICTSTSSSSLPCAGALSSYSVVHRAIFVKTSDLSMQIALSEPQHGLDLINYLCCLSSRRGTFLFLLYYLMWAGMTSHLCSTSLLV